MGVAFWVVFSVIMAFIAIVCFGSLCGNQTESDERKISKISIWREESQKGNAIGNAVVGGVLFGGVGAVVGAASTQDDVYVTFKVEYDNGDIEFEKVKTTSTRYDDLIRRMQYLESKQN